MIVATVLADKNATYSRIHDAVDSVQAHVDCVIFVDLSPTDAHITNAIPYLRSRGIRVMMYSRMFDWCGDDFAAARNYAMQCAQEFGCWAFTLDTDERFRFSITKEELESQLARADIDSWLAYTVDGYYAKERVIRVPQDARWVGRVHECFVGSRRATLKGVKFWELPKSAEQLQRKFSRDLKALEAMRYDNPGDARTLYYLGQTHQGLGDTRSALRAFGDCLAIRNQWSENAAWAAFCAAKILVAADEWTRAAEVAMVGWSRQIHTPELPWIASFAKYSAGELDAAEYLARQAIAVSAMPACHARIGFRFLPAWYESPYDVLAHVFRLRGNEVEQRKMEELVCTRKQARQNSCPPGDG